MEEPINSSVSSGDLCNEDCSEASGESTWTMYLEDFMASDGQREAPGAGSFSSCSAAADSTGSSVVSDAASCAVPNTSTGLQAPGGYKKLRMKRKKGWGLLQDDDPLEDTASSPVNSPKVSDLSHTAMESRKRSEDDHRDMFDQLQEDDSNHRNGPGPKKELAANGYNNCVEKANDCTELRRRGICLVPVSMLVNYLGQ